jgi:hypothetical protein
MRGEEWRMVQPVVFFLASYPTIAVLLVVVVLEGME